jgi:hypothetical protein
MRRNILFLALLLAACDAPTPSEPAREAEDEPTPRAAGYCGQVVPPESSGMITEDDIARIEALPYYASTALDLPNDEEILGNALLTVEPDGKVVLRLTTTDVDLRRTVFAELDLGDALVADGGHMFAELDGKKKPFGSISINGESGMFLQGTLVHAKLEAQPSGVFALELQPGTLDTWPPDAEVDPKLKNTIEQLEQQIRVVGRLHGSCMVEIQDGAHVRVMDIEQKPKCAELLAWL